MENAMWTCRNNKCAFSPFDHLASDLVTRDLANGESLPKWLNIAFEFFSVPLTFLRRYYLR